MIFPSFFFFLPPMNFAGQNLNEVDLGRTAKERYIFVLIKTTNIELHKLNGNKNLHMHTNRSLGPSFLTLLMKNWFVQAPKSLQQLPPLHCLPTLQIYQTIHVLVCTSVGANCVRNKAKGKFDTKEWRAREIYIR